MPASPTWVPVTRCDGWPSMPELTPRVVAVNVVFEIRRGPTRDSAIDKRPVAGTVSVSELGLAGDRQCDTRHHGGLDRALYAYASEDADWWAEQLGREITPGLFGENLTTAGIDVTHALIGERWKLGDEPTGPIVEVRMPRAPCGNLSARMQIPGFHSRFAATGRVGAYLKVLAQGAVSAGDLIRVIHRPGHGVTIANWCRDGTPELARRLLDSDVDLAQPMRRSAARRARRDRHSDG